VIKLIIFTVGITERLSSGRPDIDAGWPDPGFPLQTVCGGSLPILKEVLLTLTLGPRPLTMWVFFANIADELILGLDILRAYVASVAIGRQKLRLAEEEVSLWSPGAGPRPSSFVVAKDHVIPAQSEGIVMTRMENHLGIGNGVGEPNPQASYNSPTSTRD
jgi:hypothetical protein